MMFIKVAITYPPLELLLGQPDFTTIIPEDLDYRSNLLNKECSIGKVHMKTSQPSPTPRHRTINGPARWLFLLALATFACGPAQFFESDSNDPGEESSSDSPEETLIYSDPEAVVAQMAEETGMTLEQALSTPSEDHQVRLLELMGPPDTFRLTFQELEGTDVRWEEWAYYDLGARFDFVDGHLLWTVDLEPAPDLAIYAHLYDPREFTANMSPAEAKALLVDQEVAEMDLAEGDIPGGLMMGADQLMLGFDQERLVYAESYYLTLEVQP